MSRERTLRLTAGAAFAALLAVTFMAYLGPDMRGLVEAGIAFCQPILNRF